MKFLLSFLIIYSVTFTFGQHNFIPLHSFYKDQLFANKLKQPYNGGSFLPVTESKYDLISAINDSSKQYYDFTEILLKKHLFEFKGPDYYITISPVADITRGKDISDTNQRNLFQNTRGVHVEGDLFTNFSFATSLFENQARFTEYQSTYYSLLGEQYYLSDSSYQTQNAAIPGGGRTKPFKGDAFDYASAVGYFVYTPIRQIQISAGNNMQFIGDGYRSLLLSDNSFASPYFRIDWTITEKFSFTYYRTRYLNLLRKPFTSSAESYYESKGYSVNYFTYKPTDKINVSLFEGNMWNRGDAKTSYFSHSLYYNPLPFISGIALKDQGELVSMIGMNLGIQLLPKHRIYGQFALNDFDSEKTAFQLGYRTYHLFGLNDFMLQLEYNDINNKTYQSAISRLNYTHFNMPLAHVKGNGFQEFVFRLNYEYIRFYIDLKSIFYKTKDYSPTDLLAFNNIVPSSNDNIYHQTLETGYRFNRKMNLSIFGSWVLRTSSDGRPTNFMSFGMKTALTNHYSDF